MKKMFKKKTLFISFFIFCLLWVYFFPITLGGKFISTIEKKCSYKENCTISLHKVTSFKWDKAYFFAYDSGYNLKEIQDIVGVHGDFRHDRDTQAIFVRDGKIVKQALFSVMDGLYEPLLPSYFTYKNFGVSFVTNKARLLKLGYAGNLNDFVDLIGIRYYELTPENDRLFAGCSIVDLHGLSLKDCVFNFTNLNQVKLFNPKINNHYNRK